MVIATADSSRQAGGCVVRSATMAVFGGVWAGAGRRLAASTGECRRPRPALIEAPRPPAASPPRPPPRAAPVSAAAPPSESPRAARGYAANRLCRACGALRFARRSLRRLHPRAPPLLDAAPVRPAPTPPPLRLRAPPSLPSFSRQPLLATDRPTT